MSFAATWGRATWGRGAFTGDTVKDEQRVRAQFWPKAKAIAAGLPFAEDLVTAYYCAFDQATPLQVKATLIGALAYFVLPFDFVPDILPLIGFTDDAAVLITAIKVVAGHVRPEHRGAARAALARLKEEAKSRAA
jgi:uncharacterized membrane protein YkvA (DUF1232 family)